MKRLDRAANWHWEQDESLRFVVVHSFENANRALSDTLVGKRLEQLLPANQFAADWQHYSELLKDREPFFNFELEVPHPNGSSLWMSLCGIPVNDAAGNFKGYRGVAKDITQQKESDTTIASLSLIDQLTGLSNRRLLLERLNFARISGIRTQEFGALVFVDIDKFKNFNEAVGHDVADVLLIEVGERLSSCMRDCDTVARIAGDVFVVLATELGSDSQRASQNIQRISDKIYAALDTPFTAAMDIALTVSPLAPQFGFCMGISLFQGAETSAEEAMKRAEMALQQAKLAGRQVIRYFDPMVEAQVNHRTQVEKELHLAMATQQLRVFYQPIVNLQKEIVGYEALIRWQHPSLGLLAPSAFIDIAEESGLIVPIGAWVVEQACQQLLAFRVHPAKRHLTVAVNLSARQLAQADIADAILHIVQSTGAPPELLKLEITESMLLTDIDKTIAKMDRLSAMGIRFSLDDFGTGYSSLAYLKKLPLSVLKIDQSFVYGLLTEPVDAAIVRTIIQLAKSLGLAVIVEGVENEGQRKVLADMGCKEFQGYLFGRPAPLGDGP